MTEPILSESNPGCKVSNKYPIKCLCAICNTPFTIDNYKQNGKKYCSHGCVHKAEYNERRRKHRENIVTVECKHCGAEFKKFKEKAQMFCSNECYIAFNKPTIESIECRICGTIFQARGKKKYKYCSDECSKKAQEQVFRVHTAKRRALRVTNGRCEKINPKDIFDRDGWRCQLCGKKVNRNLYKTTGTKRYLRAPSLDHIIPVSLGGQHTHANVQCACYICNVRKSNKPKGQLKLFG